MTETPEMVVSNPEVVIADVPLDNVVVPETYVLPDVLATWVTTGMYDHTRLWVPNPFDVSRPYPHDTTQWVVAWKRRRVLLRTKAAEREFRVGSEEHGELIGMDAAATLHDMYVRSAASVTEAQERLSRAVGKVDDYREMTMTIFRQLMDEAEERDWCDDFEKFIDEVLPEIRRKDPILADRVAEATDRMTEIELSRTDEVTVTVTRTAMVEVSRRDYNSGDLDYEELWNDNCDEEPDTDDVVSAMYGGSYNVESSEVEVV